MKQYVYKHHGNEDWSFNSLWQWLFCRYYQTRARALAQEQVDVTRSLINVNEEQNEIFRGSAQGLEPLVNIAETAIRELFYLSPSDVHCLLFV